MAALNPAFDRIFTEDAVPVARTISEWRGLVRTRQTRIGVIGLGYVGLPLTLLFSGEGFRVTGFDVDSAKINMLNQGASYIWRIEPEHILSAKKKGFTATSDFDEIARMDAVIICVPTPLTEYHAPDLSYVEATVQSIAPHVHKGQLIVLESTTYPGTTEEIVVSILNKAGKSMGLSVQTASEASEVISGVLVAFSPEREDPGNVITPRREIPKVVGGMDAAATQAACALYESIFTRTVPVSSPATAEMTKLLENVYRSVNIAVVNEMKQLCMKMGVDIWEVIDAAATKPFGFQPFYPGPGIGGHCIPVDPFYLAWKAQEYGFTTRLIQLAGEVNEEMPAFVTQEIALALSARGMPMKGSKILVLGVAYKPDVDDLRESPAIVIIELLKSLECDVSYNDPFFPKVGRGRKYALDMISTPLDRVPEFDCVLIATDHSSYEIKRIVLDAKLVVDSRNATRHLSSPKIVRC